MNVPISFPSVPTTSKHPKAFPDSSPRACIPIVRLSDMCLSADAAHQLSSLTGLEGVCADLKCARESAHHSWTLTHSRHIYQACALLLLLQGMCRGLQTSITPHDRGRMTESDVVGLAAPP